MPNIIDETVASSAYDTSGNGGRKIVSSNNDIIMVVRNGTTEIRLYKKSGTNAPVLLANFSVTTLTDVCIENAGNGYVGILYSHSGTTVSYRTVSVSLGTLGTIVSADSGQSAVGNVTMIANSTRTEMSMAVATKNSTYANSFNIRFNKGTINADGSVTWGAVTQVSTRNTTGTDLKNPTIVANGTFINILYDYYNGSNYSIGNLRNNGSTWTEILVYNGLSYSQSSPSAIFVPQSVNGLANGRIEVTWSGLDSTDTTMHNIRYSYSDDGGITWSAMEKRTSGNIYGATNPTITANKNNEIFILYHGGSNSSATGDRRIKQIKKSNNVWGSIIEKETNQSINPSALFDLSVNFTEPLFIYTHVTDAKVGFYGTWTVTTISVTQGSIGTKSDKTNLLTYSITTDGTMSQVTEKVNGVTVDTKTLTSGQSTVVALDQTEWDGIAYGKYNKYRNILPTSEDGWEIGGLSNGSPVSSTISFRSKSFIPVLSGEEYYISAINTNYLVSSVSQYDKNKVFISILGGGARTLDSNAVYVKVVFRRQDSASVTMSEVATAQTQMTLSSTVKPFLKYGENDNTLEITMGTEKWTYTFDKRLATDADVLSAVKATQDAQTTLIPAVKSKLASAITSKGGTATGADSWDALVSAVGGLSGKKWASGTVTSTTATSSFQYTGNNTNQSLPTITVTGLTFKPSKIVVNSTTNESATTYRENGYYYPKVITISPNGSGVNTGSTYHLKGDIGAASITATGFVLPVISGGVSHEWIAYE